MKGTRANAIDLTEQGKAMKLSTTTVPLPPSLPPSLTPNNISLPTHTPPTFVIPKRKRICTFTRIPIPHSPRNPEPINASTMTNRSATGQVPSDWQTNGEMNNAENKAAHGATTPTANVDGITNTNEQSPTNAVTTAVPEVKETKSATQPTANLELSKTQELVDVHAVTTATTESKVTIDATSDAENKATNGATLTAMNPATTGATTPSSTIPVWTTVPFVCENLAATGSFLNIHARAPMYEGPDQRFMDPGGEASRMITERKSGNVTDTEPKAHYPRPTPFTLGVGHAEQAFPPSPSMTPSISAMITTSLDYETNPPEPLSLHANINLSSPSLSLSPNPLKNDSMSLISLAPSTTLVPSTDSLKMMMMALSTITSSPPTYSPVNILVANQYPLVEVQIPPQAPPKANRQRASSSPTPPLIAKEKEPAWRGEGNTCEEPANNQGANTPANTRTSC
eukprot:GHVU01034572.1.p1 GENE.GHVU01034572.1~~GHVU01034572.1.p1  ORF type:complete len:455 (-),score=48.60 GHVU01034572.1:539-1903(-)